MDCKFIWRLVWVSPVPIRSGVISYNQYTWANWPNISTVKITWSREVWRLVGRSVGRSVGRLVGWPVERCLTSILFRHSDGTYQWQTVTRSWETTPSLYVHSWWLQETYGYKRYMATRDGYKRYMATRYVWLQEIYGYKRYMATRDIWLQEIYGYKRWLQEMATRDVWLQEIYGHSLVYFHGGLTRNAQGRIILHDGLTPVADPGGGGGSSPPLSGKYNVFVNKKYVWLATQCNPK